jgi:hypothetical protein
VELDEHSASCLDLAVCLHVFNQPLDSPTTRNTRPPTSTWSISCETAATKSPIQQQITHHDARATDHHRLRPPGHSKPRNPPMRRLVSILTTTVQLYLSAFFGLVPLPAKIQQDVIPVVRPLHPIPCPSHSIPSAHTLSCSFPSGPSYLSAPTSWANLATASTLSKTHLKRTRNFSNRSNWPRRI